MGKWLVIPVAAFCATLCAPTRSDAATNYFLVAEPTGRIVRNDSYVIGLTNAQHIAHARDLIARGSQAAGAPILVANVVAGEDGINRDLRRDGARWCWHVTSVTGFADATIEILDGWPSERGTNYPCSNPGTPTGLGQIGFWNYTVVAELPLTPQVSISQAQPEQLKLALSNLTPPFPVTIEFTTNLSFGGWETATNFVTEKMAAAISLPFQGRAGFFRVRAQ